MPVNPVPVDPCDPTRYIILMEPVEGSLQPILNRDLQILVGEQIFTGVCGCYINDGFLNLFVASPTVRSSLVSVLSKMTVFTLNDRRARISSPTDNRKFVCIDFRNMTGYVYLKHLVQLLMESRGKFFDVLHLISLKGVDVEKLFTIFMMLKDLIVINIPYEFDSFLRIGESKKLDKLIERNAGTLRSVHHLVYPFSLLPEIRNGIVAINSATLRTGSMEREADFFAFYMDKKCCPKELLLPEDGGILMNVSINRCREVLRSVKRAFQRDNIRPKITKFGLSSTYDFDTKSAQILLAQIERIRNTLPNVQSLSIELRTLEFNPNQDRYSADDFPEWEAESDLVPNSASVCSNVALFFVEWLRKQKCGDLRIDGCVRLAVDYHCGKETDNAMLEKALRETIARAVGQNWTKLLEESVTVRNGCASAIAKVGMGDKYSFSFCIEFRSITFCDAPGHFEKNLFRVVNSL